MSLDTVTEEIRARLGKAVGLQARVKFDFGDNGVVFVDTTRSPATVSHEDEDADTTFACKIEVFQAILDGAQDPTLAFMMGKLKVRGSMGLAMKLNGILEA